MKRKTFDFVASAGGAVLTIVLIVAGVLLVWGHNFAANDVHNQLAKQEITFPTLKQLDHPTPPEITATMKQYLAPYAGQQLLTGQEAEVYADHFIAKHLTQMPLHGVYSKVSAASMQHPTTAKLAAEVQTTFRGTTLRGLLLEAYAFSVFGTIAGLAAWFAFIFGGVMLLLTIAGLVHYGRVSEDVEIPRHRTEVAKAA